MLQQFTAPMVACLCLVHVTDASNLSNFFNKVAGLEKQARQNGLTKKEDIALYVTRNVVEKSKVRRHLDSATPEAMTAFSLCFSKRDTVDTAEHHMDGCYLGYTVGSNYFMFLAYT